MAADPGKYDALIAAISGSGASQQSTVLGGGPARVAGTTSIRQAERGRGPLTKADPATGFQYPISGLGTGKDGYTEEDVTKLLRSMPPERIAQIQRQMQMSGLLPKNHSARGFVDAATRNGFAEVLEMSNSRGSTYASTLQTLASGAETVEDLRKASARRMAELAQSTRLNTYERSDPASVRLTAEQAFAQALGRKPKPDEMERFVTGFLGQERAVQSTVFAAQDSLAAADRSRSLEAADLQDAASAPAIQPAGGNSEAQVLMARLQQMVKDAPGKITLGPTTRDLATQKRLYAAYKAGKGPQAAKPGTSKHGDGRANDLKYENDKVRQWALANAHKYGLAFPIYNPKLPRNRDESWHIEVKKGTLPPGHSQGDGHNHGAPASGSGMPPISQDVTSQRVDAGAQALEFARTQNPIESAAFDVGGQFNSFVNILQRGFGG